MSTQAYCAAGKRCRHDVVVHGGYAKRRQVGKRMRGDPYSETLCGEGDRYGDCSRKYAEICEVRADGLHHSGPSVSVKDDGVHVSAFRCAKLNAYG